MVDEKPLYEDPDITIDYMRSSPQYHVLILHKEVEATSYLFGRGVLKDGARTPRHKLEGFLKNYNEPMVIDAEMRGLNADALGVAIAQAHIEEERRIELSMCLKKR